MKSMVMTRFGDIDVFQQVSIPKPEVKAGHVVIKVMATSVNPLDYKLRKGDLPDLVPSFPMVLHGDVAGVIDEVGEGVNEFAVGDKVYGCIGGILDMDGALSEYVLADINLIAKKPKKLSFLEAAALPLVALTAWEGLVTYANITKGQTVLIHGGTGGVGHIAIQLAKWFGAKVYTTCSSTSKMDIAKRLGADVTINYKEQNAVEYTKQLTQGKGFDIVFDTVGSDNLLESFNAAKIFGQVITIQAAGQFDLTPAFLKGLSLHMVLQPLPLITGLKRQTYKAILSKIAELADAEVIKPLIDINHFTIPEVGAAHQYAETGEAIGKIVLSI